MLRSVAEVLFAPGNPIKCLTAAVYKYITNPCAHQIFTSIEIERKRHASIAKNSNSTTLQMEITTQTTDNTNQK